MPHMHAAQEELSFTYFPENYRWSHGLLIGLNMAPWGGAEIGEINRIGLRLKNRVGDDNAWFREWAREARTVEDRGRERIADGRTLSLARSDTPALSVASQHILWVVNATSQEEALKRLAPFKLDGVVQKIACPFVMLHGEGDEQIPLAEAQKCFDAVGSKQKTMKVFTREEGGYHHCQIDNQSICSAYMWDWLEQVLQPAR
jgi:pimeloyl-ACP methyl ester carboxylesterase